MTLTDDMSTDTESVSSSTCTSPSSPSSPWLLVDGDGTFNDGLNDSTSHQDFDEVLTTGKSSAKLKKKVSFPLTDDELVSIREIPSRDEMPLVEELAPCDPTKLVAEMVTTPRPSDTSPRRYECSNKNAGRSQNLVAEITGMNVYGNAFASRSMSKVAARQLSQNLRKNKDNCSENKQPSKQKRVAIKQMSTQDIADKMRVASAKEKGNRNSRRNTASAKKERERTKKQKSPTGGDSVGKQKKPVYSFEPQSHKPATKAHKERSRQAMVADSANISQFSDPLVLPEVFTTRVLTSPYKQSYGVIPDIRHRPLSTPPFGHVQTESGFIFPNDSPLQALRVKSAGSKPQEITIERHPNKTKQKIYAWNVANGNAVEATPCIAPMWDIAKLTQAAESVKIT